MGILDGIRDFSGLIFGKQRTTRQEWALVIGLGICLFAFVFAPWTAYRSVGGELVQVSAARRWCLSSSISVKENELVYVGIDYWRLFLEWAVIAAPTITVIWLLKGRKILKKKRATRKRKTDKASNNV